MNAAHRKIHAAVKILRLKVKATHPLTEDVDGEIELGGKFAGYHIQLGSGYYNVVRELKDGSFLFQDGRGNLAEELRKLADHKLERRAA